VTPVESVRLSTGDKSSLERKRTTGNGVDRFFELGHEPVIQSTPPVVTLANVPQVEGVNYTVDYINGTITFSVAPAANAEIVILYYWSVFSDAEIQHFLDASGSSSNLATARVLLAMAADAARIAKRETLSGGGGSGTRTIDTSVAAKELRETARAFVEIYNQEEGTNFPAEGLTEVPWTEFTKEQAMIQDWIREN
jgi:hypothetical protein